MREIDGFEEKWLEPLVYRAVEQAELSPCQKSKRGAVVFKDGRVLGRGYNHPDYPHECCSDRCQDLCAEYAIHAERAACYDAIARGNSLDGASILHMKIKNREVVPVEKIGCDDCSHYLIKLRNKGIYMVELVLMYPDGFRAFSIDEFYQSTHKS